MRGQPTPHLNMRDPIEGLQTICPHPSSMIACGGVVFAAFVITGVARLESFVANIGGFLRWLVAAEC